MSTLLDNFRICDTIDTNIRHEIKLFHVFGDINDKKNILFVTNNDTVYGLGANVYGRLGFGHNMDVKTPLIIRELCGQRIQQFINGKDFVLAMDDAGLPEDPEFRAVMRAYMESAVDDVALSHPGRDTVPLDAAMPRWTWDGPQLT